MKKILALLFLFLSSFCLTSCFDSVEKCLQFGYDFVTLPTEVSEDFLLLSYTEWQVYGMEFDYSPHNTDIIRIEQLSESIYLPNGGHSYKKACIARSEHDVDVIIECFITCGHPEVRVKTFTITVLGLENDELENSI